MGAVTYSGGASISGAPTDKPVRVREHWRRKPKTKPLYLSPSLRVGWSDPVPAPEAPRDTSNDPVFLSLDGLRRNYPDHAIMADLGRSTA